MVVALTPLTEADFEELLVAGSDISSAPMPDYSRKNRKEPVATIRMTTKTKLKGDLLCSEELGLRSKIDPAKYLGSNISLTDSLSSLRHTPPHKPSDPLLQELSDLQFPSSSDQDSSVWTSPRQIKSRTLGVTRRSATAPLLTANGRRVVFSRDSSYRPSSSGSCLLPTISQNKTKLHGYEINGEVDADATIVDADAVLDQGSEQFLKEMEHSYTSYPRPVTPPLPSADVLSKRQLKLIGTNTENTSNVCSNTGIVDEALSKRIISKETLPSPKEQEITPSDLIDMVGTVGERMLVNRARLLLLQHDAGITNDGNNVSRLDNVKPPTAPCGMARPSPLQSTLTIESRSTVGVRATTAPPVRTSARKQMIRSSKLRSSSGCGTWSVPCKSEGRARADKLLQPFIIQSINPTNHRSEQPAPPPTESSASTLMSARSSGTETELPFSDLHVTPYSERCAKYRDPLHVTRGYSPLSEEVSLSETPLIQPIFSSLSSFLPSTPDLLKHSSSAHKIC